MGGAEGDLLKTGGAASATAGVLPSVIRRFRHVWPAVEIKVFEMLSAPALHRLVNRSLDLAFVRVPPREAHLRSRLVLSERIVAALPAGHPAAREPAVPAAAVAAEPLVIPARSHRPIQFDLMRAYFAARGLEPCILQKANERHMIVAAGPGVSLLPVWVSRFAHADVVFRALEDGGPRIASTSPGTRARRSRPWAGCSTACRPGADLTRIALDDRVLTPRRGRG